MEKIKIGFVPAHREPFDENWAVEMRKRTLAALSAIKDLEIVVPNEKLTQNGLVRNDDDSEKTIQLFKEKKIDGIVIGTMTFGDEISAVTIAASFPECPVLLFGTKEGPFTKDGARLSDSFCGTLSVSSGLYRRKIPFLFAGICFPEEPTFPESVANFIRTCAIAKGFLNARIGSVGPRPERFETCAFNEAAMIKQFKQRVVHVSLADILYNANNLKDDNLEVQRVIQEIKEQANTSAISEESVKKIAKLECALEQFAEEKRLSAMGVQCWTAMQKVYGVSPCMTMGRLTDQGVMTSCEVDIYGALTMLVQYLASLKTTPPHFIDWTIKHQEKENVFLAWHCGNAPPSTICEGCKVTVRYHSILGDMLGPEQSQGTGEFQLKPGPVTICRLVEYDGKFKMLITRGKIIESAQELRGSWSWVEVENLELLYNVLVKEGFTHHAGIIHGDYVKAISDFCDFVGIDTVIVEPLR
jgi:L-fucose isomerase-like protein